MREEGTREAPIGLNDVPSIVLDTVGYMWFAKCPELPSF